MHAPAMNESERIPALLGCIGDPSRYRVLGVIAEGDYSVSEIAVRIGLSQSCTTRHLQVLQRAGVLSRTRAGKRVLFRIRQGDPELDRVLELLLVRRPLEVHSRTAPVPRRSDAIGTPAPRRGAAPGRADRAAAGVRPADEVSIPATLRGDVASDAPGATDLPPEPVVETDSAPVAGHSNELEDFLL